MVYSEDYKKLVDATALKDKYYEIDERVEEICKEAFKGCDKLEEIVMPKKLKKIDSEAFQGCSSLTKLTLPDSVMSIGKGAFCGCSGLTELTLPNSVKSIGDGAFADCSGLTELTLSNSLVSIGGNAFRWCSELTELTLPNSVTSIGYAAFGGCSGLEKITVDGGNKRYDSRDNCNSIIDTETNTLIVGCKNSVIPNGVTSIGDSAFGWCSELTELVLPNSVTRIGDSAFEYCSGLTELTLPNSVASIGDSAFYVCSGLEKITVESGNSCYDSRDNCNSIIDKKTNTLIVGCKNSIIPNSVTRIGDYAFEYCSGLTELTLPNSVASIGDSAFEYCSGLTKLTLPNSITSIGYSAFYGCSGLTELTLPNSVTRIGDYAFEYCSGLEKITVESGNSCYDSRDNCNSIIDKKTNTLIAGCKNSVIPNSVARIDGLAFCGCSGLTELTLPNSVKSIGDGAFADCSGLEKITVESGNSCYDSRDNCNSIIETETNTLIAGCKNSVIPNSVTSIGDGAFAYCSDLSKITSLAEIPPMCGFKVFNGVNKTNCELIVPEGSVAAYTLAEDWNKFSNIRGFSK